MVFQYAAEVPEQTPTPDKTLDAAQCTLMQATWNDTAHPVPLVTFPELFEAQVARSPNAIAVVFEGSYLTYAELNARANRLAHRLIANGAGPERIVALSLPRSLELVVAVLGILKSGASYVPLDPAYPAERLAFRLISRILSTLGIALKLNDVFDAPTVASLAARLDAAPVARSKIPIRARH